MNTPAAVVEGPGLPMPKYTIGASHDWPVEREFYDAEQMREYALAYCRSLAAEESVIGECVEIGSDAEGQPRIIIHATVEALRGHARAILYRNVRVTLAPPTPGTAL